ncbi:hypothetical protein ACFC3R_12200 [Enterococcus durans]|uniref:hypothetical protein n=1 Tax=Enterococcus durans TaxID=53345 RepID=UPI0039A67701
MINQLQYTNTFTQINKIEYTGNSNNLLSSKVVTSVCMILISFGSTNPISTYKPISEIKISDQAEDNISVNFLNSFNSGKIITNKSEADDIIKLNNEHMEVEDLAERVTQAQVDEIKLHFDTKLKANKIETINEVRDIVQESEGKILRSIQSEKEAQQAKKESFISNYKAPIITGLIVAVLTNIDKIYSFLLNLFK